MAAQEFRPTSLPLTSLMPPPRYETRATCPNSGSTSTLSTFGRPPAAYSVTSMRVTYEW